MIAGRWIAGGMLWACACGGAAVVVPQPSAEAGAAWASVTQPSYEVPSVSHAFAGLLELPAAESGTETIVQGKHVVVTREAIGFAGQEVVRLVDGRVPAAEVKDRVITKLHALLAVREDEGWGDGPAWVLGVFADRGLRFDQVVGVLTTGKRAGAVWWQIAVQAPGDAPGTTTSVLRVVPASFSSEGPIVLSQLFEAHDFVLVMMIAGETTELGVLLHTGEIQRLAGIPRASGWARARELAREHGTRLPHGGYPVVLFGAHPEVPLGRVIEALEAVSGEGCKPGRWGRETERCRFVDRVLMVGATSLWQLKPS